MIAQLFHVNIQISRRNADPERRFKWIGTLKYTLNDAHMTSLYKLCNGNNHYDGLPTSKSSSQYGWNMYHSLAVRTQGQKYTLTQSNLPKDSNICMLS